MIANHTSTAGVRRSILLSQGLLVLFTAAVIFLDIRCQWFWGWVSGSGILGTVNGTDKYLFLGCLYGCSIPAFVLLYSMHILLKRVRHGSVFTRENVRLLGIVSLCCFLAALLCLAFSWRFPVLLVITAAAGFVGLIVRIVKNAFQQALSMKDELDLTV